MLMNKSTFPIKTTFSIPEDLQFKVHLFNLDHVNVLNLQTERLKAQMEKLRFLANSKQLQTNHQDHKLIRNML